MNLQAFRKSLQLPGPPEGLSLHLRALWQDARSNWEAAHRMIQDEPDADAAHIHAYLHRKEGDLFNAAYWYRRAGRPVPAVSLQEEWMNLAAAACSR